MFGYFGQAYFGGAAFADGAQPPTGGVRLAADAASATDWDTSTSGLGSDETGTGTETAATTGLGIGNTAKTGADQGFATETSVATGLNTAPPVPPPDVSRCVIRFVDSVSATAGLRMDLDSAYWRVLFEGTRTPPPPMEDQRASSMLTDGELISASVYRNREVTLGLLLNAPTAAIAATEIQKLQRELDRHTNVLWWQPTDALPPQFMRTFRGPDVSDQVLDWGTSKHVFTVVIEAEPFALGEMVSLPPVSVFQDPSLIPGAPCCFDIPGQSIKGDVDTPLYITTNDADLSSKRAVFATRRRGTPGNVPWYRQAEDPGLTLGVDAIRTTTGDASGATNPCVRVDFASTNGNAIRLSGVFPGSGAGSRDWHGTYRVFARMKGTDGSTTINMQIATGTTVSSRNQRVTLTPVAGSTFAIQDLGLVQLPSGTAGRTAGYGAAHVAAGSTLYLLMERIAGSGVVFVDYLFLVPADEEYALVQFSQMTSGAGFVVDGPSGDAYPVNSAGELTSPIGQVPYVDGVLPTISPTAAVNRIFVVNGVQNSVSVTTVVSLNLAYWPKYRVVRPIST